MNLLLSLLLSFSLYHLVGWDCKFKLAHFSSRQPRERVEFACAFCASPTCCLLAACSTKPANPLVAAVARPKPLVLAAESECVCVFPPELNSEWPPFQAELFSMSNSISRRDEILCESALDQIHASRGDIGWIERKLRALAFCNKSSLAR